MQGLREEEGQRLRRIKATARALRISLKQSGACKTNRKERVVPLRGRRLLKKEDVLEGSVDRGVMVTVQDSGVLSEKSERVAKGERRARKRRRAAAALWGMGTG